MEEKKCEGLGIKIVAENRENTMTQGDANNAQGSFDFNHTI